MLEVKIKQLSPESVIPTYAKDGDAGMDLTATSKAYDEHGNVCYGTSLAFEEWYKEEDPFHGNDDNDDVIWAKKFMFKAWQASAQRQGFKLVPIEPTKGMLRELSSNDMNGRMIYKAMIDAV